MVSKPYVVLILAIPAYLDALRTIWASSWRLARADGQPMLELLPKLMSELIQASAAVHVRSRHPQ